MIDIIFSTFALSGAVTTRSLLLSYVYTGSMTNLFLGMDLGTIVLGLSILYIAYDQI